MSARNHILALEQQLAQDVIGQSAAIRNIIITLLCDGNLLLEGMPGVAKTRAIRSLASYLEGGYQRIQFTPDLLPSDITGTEIYSGHQQDGADFTFRQGPIFDNVILVDEINRAPAKVQSALLEAMEERQVTVGGKTYPLPKLFMTLATQNPVEQEGTYSLPEAQLDRFLMKVQVDYPDKLSERDVLRLVRGEQKMRYQGGGNADPCGVTEPARLPQRVIFDAWREIAGVHVSEAIEDYIVNLITATREPAQISEDLSACLIAGASPRASIALERTARAQAWLDGRDFVLPSDIQSVIYPVLRHRLMLAYKAIAQGMSADDVITLLLDHVVAG